MNWMGGARNRVKYRDERKIQQEFFERKRLGHTVPQSFTGNSSKRKKMSQDLMALHTINRAHAAIPTGSVQGKGSIKKIDLDKFKSCTRQIDDVDLGPCSPTTTPSRIFTDLGNSHKVGEFKLPLPKDPDLNTSQFLSDSEITHVGRSWNRNMLKQKMAEIETQRHQIKENVHEKKSKSPPILFGRKILPMQPARSKATKHLYDSFMKDEYYHTNHCKSKPVAVDEVKGRQVRVGVDGKGDAMSAYLAFKENLYKSSTNICTSTPCGDLNDSDQRQKLSREVSPIYEDVSSSVQNQGRSEFHFEPHFMIGKSGSGNKNRKRLHHVFNGKQSRIYDSDLDQTADTSPRLLSYHDKQSIQDYFKDSSVQFVATKIPNESIITEASGYASGDENSTLSSYIIDQDYSDNASYRYPFPKHPRSDNPVCIRSEISPTVPGANESAGSASSLSRYRKSLNSSFENLDQSHTDQLRKPMTKDLNNSKPKFTAIDDDDFVYKPQLMFSQGKESLDENIEETRETTRACELTTRDKISGTSTLRTPPSSPRSADSFPNKLQYPINQALKLSTEMNIKTVEDSKEQESNIFPQEISSPVSYQPKSQIDDVLAEMAVLEEEDANYHKGECKTRTELEFPKLSQDEAASESFEADLYLHSDHLLTLHIPDEVELKKYIEESSQDSDMGMLIDKAILDCEKTLAKASESIDNNDEDRQVTTTYEKTEDNKKNMEKTNNKNTSMDNSNEVVEKVSDAGKMENVKDCDVDSNGNLNDRRENTMDTSMNISLETKENNGIDGQLKITNPENTTKDIADMKLSITDNIRDETIIDTDDKLADSVMIVNKENVNRIMKSNEHLHHLGSASEMVADVDDGGTLQDSEVTSGISQYTQTLVDGSRVFIDAATSPHQKTAWTRPTMLSTGTQCDMLTEVRTSSIPKLSNLASQSMNFISRFVLHKSDTVNKTSNVDDEE